MEKATARNMIESMEISPELKKKLLEQADELDTLFDRLEALEASNRKWEKINASLRAAR